MVCAILTVVCAILTVVCAICNDLFLWFDHYQVLIIKIQAEFLGTWTFPMLWQLLRICLFGWCKQEELSGAQWLKICLAVRPKSLGVFFKIFSCPWSILMWIMRLWIKSKCYLFWTVNDALCSTHLTVLWEMNACWISSCVIIPWMVLYLHR